MGAVEEAYQAVIRSPWPDAPRRAFADAVEPSDPARAAYVRLQLDLAAAQRARVAEAYPLKMASLGVVPAPAWHHGVEALVAHRTGVFRPTWGRGFIEGVLGSASAFLQHAGALYAAQPILDLQLRALDVPARDLFDAPLLARLRSLSLASVPLTDDDVAALCDSPFLARLRVLDLNGCGLTDASLARLATAPTLPALCFLHLANNRFPDPTPRTREEDGIWAGLDPGPGYAAFLDRFGPRPWLGRYPVDAPPPPNATHGPEGD